MLPRKYVSVSHTEAQEARGRVVRDKSMECSTPCRLRLEFGSHSEQGGTPPCF